MNLQFLHETFLSQYPDVKGFSLVKVKRGAREVICDILIAETTHHVSVDLKYEENVVGELILRSSKPLDLTAADQNQLNGVFAPLLFGDLSTQILALSWIKDVYAVLKSNQRDWVGIYWNESFINPENEKSTDLIVGPYIGPWTPHVRIGLDAGLCGLAVREGRTVNVEDVRSDDRFLACSTSTRSEIVIPIRDSHGAIIGELDIDSNEVGAFDRVTEIKLQDLVQNLRTHLHV